MVFALYIVLMILFDIISLAPRVLLCDILAFI